MALTIPTSTMRAVMTTLGADSTTFKAAVAHLYANPVTVTPATPLAALTEANFSGYAQSATITWNGPGSDGLGNGYLFADIAPFVASSTTTTNTIYGGYLTGSGSASTTLLGIEPFANSIPIGNAGDFVQWIPQIVLPGPGTSQVSGP